jgi:hypothetical protein
LPVILRRSATSAFLAPRLRAQSSTLIKGKAKSARLSLPIA